MRTSSICGLLVISVSSVAHGAVIYVDLDAGAGAQDGTSWANACLHPQDAVDNGTSGDELHVAQGTYTRRAAADENVLVMTDGISVYGGYAGFGEPSPDTRDTANTPTILDGETVCVHVVLGASNATFDGVRVINGNATAPSTHPVDAAAGMYNNSAANLTINDCVFDSNVARRWGAAMVNQSCTSLTVSSCMFSNNSATWTSLGHGAAMFNYGSSPTVTNCAFTGNTAAGRGGAVFTYSSGPGQTHLIPL